MLLIQEALAEGQQFVQHQPFAMAVGSGRTAPEKTVYARA